MGVSQKIVMDIFILEASPEVIAQVQQCSKLIEDNNAQDALSVLIGLHNSGKVTLTQANIQ